MMDFHLTSEYQNWLSEIKSREVLAQQIKSNLYARAGKVISNFDASRQENTYGL